MRYAFIVMGLLFGFTTTAQETEDPQSEWQSFWEDQTHEFQSKETSPLKEADRVAFQAFELFEYNPEMRIKAKFSAIEDAEQFKMKTSTDRRPVYQTVGKLEFEVGSVQEELFVYRNVELSQREGFANYLFVPFTDLTNGEQSYGGGRYVDLEGPLGMEVVIDLNMAYNPYCAYNDKYSCPVPPIENHLEMKVKAGVLAFKKDQEHKKSE